MCETFAGKTATFDRRILTNNFLGRRLCSARRGLPTKKYCFLPIDNSKRVEWMSAGGRGTLLRVWSSLRQLSMCTVQWVEQLIRSRIGGLTQTSHYLRVDSEVSFPWTTYNNYSLQKESSGMGSPVGWTRVSAHVVQPIGRRRVRGKGERGEGFKLKHSNLSMNLAVGGAATWWKVDFTS